jgi:hypothetical protein
MKRAEFGLLARSRFECLFEALIDPACCERVMLLLFGGYAATWSIYAAIAKSSQDIHPDMGEIVAWSREAGIGTPKHPPSRHGWCELGLACFPERIGPTISSP